MIPKTWPPEARVRAAQFRALLKYYRMSRTLGEAAAPFYAQHLEGRLSDPHDIVRGASLISYWLASMQTLCEGWTDLGLENPAVDAQRTTENLKLLNRYRNTVFHFQADLEESRIIAFERSHEAIGWAVELGTAFQEFFDPHLEAVQIDLIRGWLFAIPDAG